MLFICSCSVRLPDKTGYAHLNDSTDNKDWIFTVSTWNKNLYTLKDNKGKLIASATAIKECNLKENMSPIATTRQLLVGLDSIHVSDREEIIINDNLMLLTKIEASMDARQLDIAVFTEKNERCVYDVVVWQEANTSKVAFDTVIEHFRYILPEIIK